MAHVTFVLAALMLVSTLWGQALPEAKWQASAWQPMAGSPAAEETQIDGRRAVRMNCSFSGGEIPRASWDLPVELDMGAAAALLLDVWCADPDPVALWVVYLQSGDGWYTASVAPEERGRWTTLRISKSDTRIEGKPAGWTKIRAIRVSAWRGRSTDTYFAIGRVALEEAGGDVVVIRNESLASSRPGELQSACDITGRLCDLLEQCGISYRMISDLEVTGQSLPAEAIAVLPHDPQLSEAAQKALLAHLGNDGRVLGFYGIPPDVAAAGGVRIGWHIPQKAPGNFAQIRSRGVLRGAPDNAQQQSWNIVEAAPIGEKAKVSAEWLDSTGKPAGAAIVASDKLVLMTHVMLTDDVPAKRQLLTAMLGHLRPGIWKQAASNAVSRIAEAVGIPDFASAEAMLKKSERAQGDLRLAAAAREKALRLLAEAQYVEAIAASEQSRQLLIAAYAKSQSSLSGEHRAFWCHRAFGIGGMDWDQSIKLLADNGFTAILPNMLWGGLAYYPSKVLPQAEGGRDYIAECLAACRKYGVQCHIWKVNWNMSGLAPREFVERMKSEGRTQMEFGGKAQDNWLCPSHPANQQLEIDAMVEVATKYDVDGIHFDYIRYPGPESCYCAGCRERFEAVIGRKVEKWPAATRDEAEIRRQWLDFRRENINKVVAAVADRVHRERPGVKVSAAVFANWSVDRDTVGQDWKLWCERGYLDFVCPMDYTASNGTFRSQVANQKTWAGKVPLYPGIGLSTWPGGGRDFARLCEQIGITREAKTGGFTIFEYDAAAAREIVPLCGEGITRRP